MKLIKKTGLKKIINSYSYCGMFVCTFCSSEVEKTISNGKKSKSCGCRKGSITHGLSKTRIYSVWRDIKRRCYDPSVKAYKNYGERGIQVCDEWMNFIVFYKWCLSNGYDGKLEIDRIDNNKNYNPENCRFVTKTINLRNSRATKLNWEKVNEIRSIYINKKLTQVEIGKIFNVSQVQIGRIVNNQSWES